MTSFEVLLQQALNALTKGSLYAAAAIGLAMVFSILNLINFAHGDLLALGLYAMVAVVSAGLPFWLAVVAGVVVAALGGVIMERVAYRPLRGAPDVSLLLTSFAISILIQNGIVLFISANPKAFVLPAWLGGAMTVGNLRLPVIDAAIIVSTLAMLGMLTFLVTRTKLGIALRATASDLMGARLCGIAINKVVVFAFIVGSGLAGLAGIGWAGRIGKIEPTMGLEPVLKGFVACVFGGFGKISGAVLGGYVLGGLEILFTAFLPTAYAQYRDAYVFIVLIAALLIRPSGLLGTTEKEKV